MNCTKESGDQVKRLRTQIHTISLDICSVKEIPIYLDVQIQRVRIPNGCVK